MTHKACSYTLIRYVPDSARGEFINVGVMVLDHTSNRVVVKHLKSFKRVRSMFTNGDPVFARRNLTTLGKAESLSELLAYTGLGGGEGAEPEAGPELLNQLRIQSRNNIQFSEPRMAMGDVDDMANRLFLRLVQPPVKVSSEERRINKAVMRSEFAAKLRSRNLLRGGLVKQNFEFRTGAAKHRADFGYLNDVHHFVRALPMVQIKAAREQVNSFRMFKVDLSRTEERESHEAELTALYHLPEQDAEREDLLGAMKEDGIMAVPYAQSDRLVESIQMHLSPHMQQGAVN